MREEWETTGEVQAEKTGTSSYKKEVRGSTKRSPRTEGLTHDPIFDRSKGGKMMYKRKPNKQVQERNLNFPDSDRARRNE